MHTILQRSFLILMILVIQFASFGLLINKHYCKGRLTETSILLANKGCAKDASILDRILHSLDDCHPNNQNEGINKSPCCEFNSLFDKISVYHETLPDFQSIGYLAFVLEKIEKPTIDIPRRQVLVHFIDRGPPDRGIDILIKVCRLLI
jgi:hypothetical protein